MNLLHTTSPILTSFLCRTLVCGFEFINFTLFIVYLVIWSTLICFLFNYWVYQLLFVYCLSLSPPHKERKKEMWHIDEKGEALETTYCKWTYFMIYSKGLSTFLSFFYLLLLLYYKYSKVQSITIQLLIFVYLIFLMLKP